MNNLKLQRFLVDFNKKTQFIKLFNPNNFIIRLNATTTTTETSTPNNKKYPHGIDLRTLKPNNGGKYKKEGDFNLSGSLFVGLIPIITFCLGIWQIRRREWKLEMIEMLESRTESQPIALPTDLSVLKQSDYEYLPIKVRGHFDHSREILLTIKQDTTGTYSKPGGYIITPFVLADRNLTILVNRGFVPYTHYLVESRKEGQVEGDIDLVGLNRHNEIPNNFTPKNRPHLNEWHQRDVDLIAACLDTAPVFLDATIDSTKRNGRNEPIGPLGGQTIVFLRNEHLTYIVTWFSLSALTAFMWYKNFGKYLFKK